MKRYTVRVPAPHVAVTVDALIGIYARKADELASAARAHARGIDGEQAALDDARRELIEVEDLLDAVDPQPSLEDAELELAGRVAAVRELLFAALIAAIDSARTACWDYEHGRRDRAALAAAIADVTALHELFAVLEASDAPDPS